MEQATGGVRERLGVADLEQFLTQVRALPSCTDEAGLVDQVAVLERIKRAISAAQLKAAVALFESQADAAQARADAEHAADGDAFTPAPRVSETRIAASVGAQVGLARRESPHRGRVFLSLARVVVTDMPHTLCAAEQGLLTEYALRLIVQAVSTLSAEDRYAVDEALASHVASGLSDQHLGALAKKFAYELDPASAVRRLTTAPQARRVSLRPAPDVMAFLTGHLPVQDGVAVYAALTRAATTAKAAGDTRPRQAIMCDTLVEAITGTRASHHDPDPAPAPTPGPVAPADPHSCAAPQPLDDPAAASAGTSGPAAEANAAGGAASHENTAPGTPDRHPATSPAAVADEAEAADHGTPGDNVTDGHPETAAGGARPRYTADEIIPGYGPPDSDPSPDDRDNRERPPSDGDPPSPAAASRVGEPGCTCQCAAHAPDPDGTPTAKAPIEVQLVMTDTALLGASTDPGTLNGHPIPAWLARQLVTDPHTRVVLRRLYTHPSTRQLIAMDKRTRLFTDGLKAFVLARDQHCRTPLVRGTDPSDRPRESSRHRRTHQRRQRPRPLRSLQPHQRDPRLAHPTSSDRPLPPRHPGPRPQIRPPRRERKTRRSIRPTTGRRNHHPHRPSLHQPSPRTPSTNRGADPGAPAER